MRSTQGVELHPIAAVQMSESKVQRVHLARRSLPFTRNGGFFQRLRGLQGEVLQVNRLDLAPYP